MLMVLQRSCSLLSLHHISDREKERRRTSDLASDDIHHRRCSIHSSQGLGIGERKK